jgi:3-hydroxyisobutyrate dehydrogenase-like beta-hydroxyacid dehydrogenase
MGSAMATHLLAAGFEVTGFDIVTEKVDDLVAKGGHAASSPGDVAGGADVVITSLATVAALRAVVGGDDGLVVGAHEGLVVVESSTMPLAVKNEARERLEAAGVAALDCTLSGTGAQAARRDLVVYASGDRGPFERALPALQSVSRSVRYVGGFGAGSKMKFVANLLVAIHNVAAAEALTLARAAGLDPGQVLQVIADGAGTSRMFEVRAPLMIEGAYEPATMKMDVYMKDLTLILDFAREVRCPTPLMSASLPYYVAALAEGRDKEDTAALFGVLQGMVARKETDIE